MSSISVCENCELVAALDNRCGLRLQLQERMEACSTRCTRLEKFFWRDAESNRGETLGDLCVCVRCGSVQSQKYESVVIGLHIRVEVVVKNRKQACRILDFVVG